MGKVVHILTADPVLRNALVARLREPGTGVAELRIEVGNHMGPLDVVVAPTTDCPPERCAELDARGANVVILAPIPRDDERERYLAAGARGYIPMNVDAAQLLRTIRDLSS
jgi:hypothetical protein